VNSSMQEQTKAVEAIAASSEQLVSLSNAMQQAVSRFKVSEEDRGLVVRK
jgi:methyl-accepting chemotaxis protein